MTNYQTAFRKEVQRLARKEIRAELESTKKTVSRHRQEIAELKRRNKELERMIKDLQTRQQQQTEGAPTPKDPSKGRRFSIRSLKSQRNRVGLSQADYAKLVGVSANTMSNWESGKTKPDDKHLEILVSLRGMGKREARRRLEMNNAGL